MGAGKLRPIGCTAQPPLRRIPRHDVEYRYEQSHEGENQSNHQPYDTPHLIGNNDKAHKSDCQSSPDQHIGAPSELLMSYPVDFAHHQGGPDNALGFVRENHSCPSSARGEQRNYRTRFELTMNLLLQRTVRVSLGRDDLHQGVQRNAPHRTRQL